MHKYTRLMLIPGLASGLALATSLAFAAPMIKFSSPADGAKVTAGAPLDVSYEFEPVPEGDHSHIYMDGEQLAVLKERKSVYKIAKVPAGTHEICIKVVNKGHTPVGQNQCIKVTAG